ncbi:hypothetical protein [Antribacter gilvus]|uniref:hypothetical protein n=1 Tax=Antribacter gilvus TaxID=2304675 RepID=UPI0013DE9BBE|nr:hypothetical protein [Antribacter gilvus]
MAGRPVLRIAAALVGAFCLVAATTSAAATVATTRGPANGTAYSAGVPEPGSSERAWKAWAAADRRAAERTDWKAEAASRGCVLTAVEVVQEVDPAYNRAMGAPADLVTTRVDSTEDCSGSPAMAQAEAQAEAGTRASASADAGVLAVPGGSRCATTSGPGTICISKGSGRITTSWAYRGSGSVSGFLRIYLISSGSSGCPTGSTFHTGPSSTWSSGQTRSTSKTQTQNGAYSTHIWKKVTVGHSDWGSTCGVL